ncbi:MAG: 30S ribosomal protein S2 [Patescibacteria group bacterium]|nr:30S ribosomal protein S2 [Patescibacteria group bacterium]
MKQVTLEQLLEAGCHFGHEVTRQNPKAREFIFEARDNIHIINLEKTKEGLDEAAAFIRDLASKNGTLIVVGTKRQARAIVEKEVKRAKDSVKKELENNIFYITNRWIGGILTNFSEVTKNFKKLKETTALLQNPESKAKYTKKEIGLFDKERGKLESFYGGVADLKKIPDALFIVDTHLEDLAVKEALKMGVQTVGIVDTNADPLVVDYPVPANDDAVGSIELIVSHIIDNWIEGKNNPEKKEENAEEKEPEKEVQPKVQKKEKPVKKEIKAKSKKTKK